MGAKIKSALRLLVNMVDLAPFDQDEPHFDLDPKPSLPRATQEVSRIDGEAVLRHTNPRVFLDIVSE